MDKRSARSDKIAMGIWSIINALILFLILNSSNAFALGKKPLKPGEASCSESPASVKLKVLTYNIQALPKPLLRGPELRFDEIVRYLDLYNYDIVMLQEVFAKSVVNKFKNSTAFPYKHFSKYYPVLPTGTGSGLITLSKFPIVLKNSMKYKRFKCATADCLAKKGSIHTRVKIKEGVEIDILNTHLQSGKKHHKIRTSQVKEMAKFRKDLDVGNPFIIGGDFNTSDNSAQYQPLLSELGVSDAWTEYLNHASGPIEDEFGWTSSNENYFKKDKPDSKNKRIDYIFFDNGANSKINIEHTRVAFKNEYYEGKKQLSDHFAVESIIRLDSEPCP